MKQYIMAHAKDEKTKSFHILAIYKQDGEHYILEAKGSKIAMTEHGGPEFRHEVLEDSELDLFLNYYEHAKPRKTKNIIKSLEALFF